MLTRKPAGSILVEMTELGGLLFTTPADGPELLQLELHQIATAASAKKSVDLVFHFVKMTAPGRVLHSVCEQATYNIAGQAQDDKIEAGGDTVSTKAVASRRHAGGQPPVIGWKLELPTTTWHLLLN